ncbi:MAG: mechanosensitive ion channel [Methylovulum sp.]|jgi:branched-chain amino acid transport system substrate-binding protein|nr:mechanosensitive ion channel [Methylovulum sp.]MCF7998622.1 mechanosensitive ion channel [Methylovulum sp.]MCF8006334.1 mechanosensitive ion channel [Methylovulum sp.]
MSEKKKLVIIIAAIALLSALASYIVYSFWFKESKHNIYIGIVTSNQGYQNSIINGINTYIEKIDNSKYVNPKNIKLQTFDSNDQDVINKINDFTNKNDVIGFVGHTDNISTRTISLKTTSKKIPFINIASIDSGISKDNPLYYSMVFNDEKQAKFLANYSRNVLGFSIVTVIHDNTEHGQSMAKQFSEVYERFGTKIHYTFPYDSNNSIDQIINDNKGKQDLGTIFFIGSAQDSAKFVVHARDANIRNKIIATDVVATKYFLDAMEEVTKNKGEIDRYTNELLFPSPLLFDTAGSEEQHFKNLYLLQYKNYPDWVSAYAYDTAKLYLDKLIKSKLSNTDNVDKNIILSNIAKFNSPDKILIGASGETWFNENRESQKPIQIGYYDGHNIIAAPTQLQLIKANTSVNYIDELKSGKMLYVNDRFMYKTNVVYTGIEVNNISKLDLEKKSTQIDLSIWFRFRGNFDPANLLFSNANNEFLLEKPVQSYEKDGVMFQKYKISYESKLDYSSQKFRHGSHLLGISFRHKNFNKNNVIYVIDDLGMDLNSKTSLKDKLYSNNVSNSLSKWKIIAAQFYQSITKVPTFGEPIYVGYGAIEPEFSKIDYEVIVAEDRFSLNDYIDSVYFVYIGIFGLLGSVSAKLIEAKYNPKHPSKNNAVTPYKKEVILFWLFSAWIMRGIFWSISLLSIGNLGIEIAIDDGLSNSLIDKIVMTYDILWWLLPAKLLNMSTDQFLWPTIENRSQRKVPGVIKHFISGILYLLFIFCIIAFVFDKPLSSLLATSGLFAMILGLGVQSNIANIVSGIIVNLEKPFTIGDFVKIKGFDRVEVIDISWRSLKVKDNQNNIISIPNSSVATSEIVNFIENFSKIEIKLYVSPKYDPDLILDHLKNALTSVKGIHDIKAPEHYLSGIILAPDSSPIAEYLISFSIYEYKKHKVFRNEIWKSIYHEFDKAKISFERELDEHTLIEKNY